ncbi:MAG: sugar ABC transporter permease, partial [Nitrospira sp.]|nr:sugar ABC transporter permease [Nitrospira sp.]
MTGRPSNGTYQFTGRVRLSERTWGYLLASPAFLLVALVAVAPIAAALWLSLHRRLPVFRVEEFVGLWNYVQLWSDDRFWAACRTTLYFTALSVAAELLLGFGLALLLDGLTSDRHGSPRWAQVMIVVPWAIPTVVSAQIWAWLYQPDYGLLNYLLHYVRLITQPIDWLADPDWAIHAAIVMDVWKTAPFAALLLLAGLKTIPRDLYAAARVDGAGAWQQFRHITLP